jgi:hypothetical protein
VRRELIRHDMNMTQNQPGGVRNPNGIVSLQPRVAEPARLPWVNRPTCVTTLKGLHQAGLGAAATPLGLGEINNDLPRVASQPWADRFESSWDSERIEYFVCHCPPSPRPSPPGEGESLARRGFSDVKGSVAGFRSFRSEDVRQPGGVAFTRGRRAIHPLLGERAGVRAGVNTN